MSNNRVRFVGTESDVLSVIEIDAPLAAGAALLTWQALFRMRAQVASAEVRIQGDRLVQRLHLSEFDGAPLCRARARELHSEMRRALR